MAAAFPDASSRAQIEATAHRARLLQEPQPLSVAGAGYGTDYQPPVPPVLTPKQQYEEQERMTADAFLRLKGVFDWLQRNVGDDEESAAFKKLQYLNMHVEQWDAITTMIAALVAYCKKKQLTSAGNLDEIFRNLTLWLRNVEVTYTDLIGYQDQWYVQRYHEAVSVIRQHPWLTATIAAIVTGGSGCAAVLHNVKMGWCIVSHFLETVGVWQLVSSQACTCAATAPGWVLSFAGGALAGALLVGAAFGIYKLYRWLRGEQAEIKAAELQKFAEIDRMVLKLNKDIHKHGLGVVATQLRRLAVRYDRFNDFSPDRDEHECPVCQEDMVAGGLQPVRFAGCEGRHFHCFGCYDRLMSDGRRSCTVCRC